MKLFKILLIITAVNWFANLNANHTGNGGEIYWECSNGEYTFYLSRFIDCGSAISFSGTSVSLDILGNPLPRDSNNLSISQIVLHADTNKWNALNQGLIFPQCSQGNGQISCTGNGISTYRAYYYKSAPIKLFGTPPQGGWHFYYGDPSNPRPPFNNISLRGTLVLNTSIFADSNQSDLSSCFENPAHFAAQPQFIHCRNSLNSLDYSANNPDGDSLVYQLARPMTSPLSLNPNYLQYAGSYSFDDPLPSTNIDTANIPLQLDSLSGLASFKVSSGVGRDIYIIKYQVHSYKNGIKVSTVSREHPMVLVDCPDLPSNITNNPPIINPPFYKGGTAYSFADSITVGQSIRVNLGVLDSNLYNQNLQDIRIELRGSALSKDLRTPTNCPDPSDVNCAILNSPPLIDSNNYEYYYQSTGGWGAQMNWQSDCDDLSANGGARTHYFYITAKDDFCPIPATSTEVIAITVLPDSTVCPNIQTSITEANELKDQLKVYPNPNYGRIFIENPTGESLDYQIFDLNGRLIERSKLRTFQKMIELPENSGIYLLKVINPQRKQAHYKLIRE